MSLRSILVAFLVAFLTPATAMAGKAHYKRLAQEFVSIWSYEKNPGVYEKEIENAFEILPGAFAFVRYEPDNHSVSIYPSDRRRPFVHIVPTEGHESEAVNYTLRSFNYWGIIAATADQTIIEILGPNAIWSTQYIKPIGCPNNFCDGTYTVVTMYWVNPRK